jgi:hypothetical protein
VNTWCGYHPRLRDPVQSGFARGRSDIVRVSVMVCPMLGYFDPSSLRTSTTLASFSDWVNWPRTLQDSSVTFKVVFGGKSTVSPVAQPDLTLLRSDCWSAMFNPTKTRVDSFVLEDFSAVVPKSFNISQVHDFLVNKPNSVYTSAASAFVAKPSSAKLIVQGVDKSGNVMMDTGTAGGSVFANLQNAHPEVSRALDLHKPLTAAPSGPAQPQVLDSHQAVASLASYPEPVGNLGLVFTLEVPFAGGSDSVAVYPIWGAERLTAIDVVIPSKFTASAPIFPSAPGGGGNPVVEWSGTKLHLPSRHSSLRLRLSELDYYSGSGTPREIDTSRRRPFVAFIPLTGT